MRFTPSVAVLVLFAFSSSAAHADMVKIKVRSANVRREASVSSPVLATVAQGTVLERIGREGKWFKVRVPQGEGFILETLAEPIAASTPEPTPAPTPTPPSPVAPAPLAGAPIEHQEIKCIVAGQHSRFDACVSNAVSRMRLNFRAEGGPIWYYVDMKKEASCHSGILPRPKKSTKRIEYYIDAIASTFAESRTPEYKPIVVTRKSECRNDPMAALLSEASVTVGTSPGAPPVPVGFEPAGIVGAAGAATIAGLSTKTLAFVSGGLVVAGVGVAVVASGGSDQNAGAVEDQDNDHDTFTPGQGDCDDHNAAVKPGGAVQIANARFENPSTTCPDQTANSPIPMPIVVDVHNNSCSSLTVSRVSGTLTIVSVQGDVLRYSPGQVVSFPNLPAAPTTVAAGQSTTLRVEPILYCDNWCGTGSMDTSGQLVVETTAGTFTVQTSVVNHTLFPLGRR